MYDKLGQACVTNWGSFVLLQIRANVVTNWGTFIITSWSKCCYKLRQPLQIRATVITKYGSYYNWGKMYYELGQVLQIRAIITNQGITDMYVTKWPHFNSMMFLKDSILARKTSSVVRVFKQICFAMELHRFH